MIKVIVYECKTALGQWRAKSYVFEDYDDERRVMQIIEENPDEYRVVKVVEV